MWQDHSFGRTTWEQKLAQIYCPTRKGGWKGEVGWRLSMIKTLKLLYDFGNKRRGCAYVWHDVVSLPFAFSSQGMERYSNSARCVTLTTLSGALLCETWHPWVNALYGTFNCWGNTSMLVLSAMYFSWYFFKHRVFFMIAKYASIKFIVNASPSLEGSITSTLHIKGLYLSRLETVFFRFSEWAQVWTVLNWGVFQYCSIRGISVHHNITTGFLECTGKYKRRKVFVH